MKNFNPRWWRRASAALLVVGFAFLGARTGRAEESAAPAGQFLLFSDLHLQINERAGAGFGEFGKDATRLLVQSAFQAARSQCQNPLFILVTGDFLDHGYPTNHQPRLLGEALGTVTKIVGWLTNDFPGVSVFPTLGNNDSLVHNQGQTPGFLRGFAECWQGLITNPGDRAAFVTSFAANGCYRATLPGLAGVQLLGLNLTFKANDPAGFSENPAWPEAPMAWAAKMLRGAQGSGEHFWLAYHVPPGRDFFKTNADGAFKGHWEDAPERNLVSLSVQPGVAATFCGHTHRDEFRVIFDQDQPAGFVHVIPSVSPVYFNHPAFQVCTVKKDGTITECSTYWLTNRLEDLAQAPDPAAGHWVKEYDFVHDYGLNAAGQPGRLDAAGLEQVRQKLRADTNAQRLYLESFAVRGPVAARSGTGKTKNNLDLGNFSAYYPLFAITNAPGR